MGKRGSACMRSRLVFRLIRHFVCKFLHSKYQVGITGDTRNPTCLLSHSCPYYFIIFMRTSCCACIVSIGLGVGSALRIFLRTGDRNVLNRGCLHVNLSNPYNIIQGVTQNTVSLWYRSKLLQLSDQVVWRSERRVNW